MLPRSLIFIVIKVSCGGNHLVFLHGDLLLGTTPENALHQLHVLCDCVYLYVCMFNMKLRKL